MLASPPPPPPPSPQGAGGGVFGRVGRAARKVAVALHLATPTRLEFIEAGHRAADAAADDFAKGQPWATSAPAAGGPSELKIPRRQLYARPPPPTRAPPPPPPPEVRALHMALGVINPPLPPTAIEDLLGGDGLLFGAVGGKGATTPKSYVAQYKDIKDALADPDSKTSNLLKRLLAAADEGAGQDLKRVNVYVRLILAGHELSLHTDKADAIAARAVIRLLIAAGERVILDMSVGGVSSQLELGGAGYCVDFYANELLTTLGWKHAVIAESTQLSILVDYVRMPSARDKSVADIFAARRAVFAARAAAAPPPPAAPAAASSSSHAAPLQPSLVGDVVIRLRKGGDGVSRTYALLSRRAWTMYFVYKDLRDAGYTDDEIVALRSLTRKGCAAMKRMMAGHVLGGNNSTDVNMLKTCELAKRGDIDDLNTLLQPVAAKAALVEANGLKAKLDGVNAANACDIAAAMHEVGATATGLTTRGAFARGRACARRRRVRASAAPPPHLAVAAADGSTWRVFGSVRGRRRVRAHFFSPPRPSPPPSRAANHCSKPECECTAANPPAGCSCKGHEHEKSCLKASEFHRVGGGGVAAARERAAVAAVAAACVARVRSFWAARLFQPRASFFPSFRSQRCRPRS